MDSVFSPNSEELAKTALKTTNTAASKRLVIVDDGEANLNERSLGDVNADGTFNINDLVTMQKWILGISDVKLADWEAGDLCEDDMLDGFDLAAMKRMLLNG
jgi:hypothetical protein